MLAVFGIPFLILSSIVYGITTEDKKTPVEPPTEALEQVVEVEPEVAGVSAEPEQEPEVREEPKEEPEENLVKVTQVVDGDTIKLSTGETVRYIGIDTPETVHPIKPVECFGKEASNKNKELVLGKEVRLEKDISETDKYGRLLRYVWVGDLLVNEYLVREGYANASSYPPDIKYQDRFTQAEREAREAGVGLWGSVCDNWGIAPPPEPVVTPTPVPTSPPVNTSYICSYNAYNCGDFSTHAEAQAVFESCGVASDIHQLDRDKDGVACETLP